MYKTVSCKLELGSNVNDVCQRRYGRSQMEVSLILIYKMFAVCGDSISVNTNMEYTSPFLCFQRLKLSKP